MEKKNYQSFKRITGPAVKKSARKSKSKNTRKNFSEKTKAAKELFREQYVQLLAEREQLQFEIAEIDNKIAKIRIAYRALQET